MNLWILHLGKLGGAGEMLKILLVDDEKFTIEGLISMLDWKGFHGELIGTASSGEEAVTLLETIHPDVIISDIKMGDMNGIELAKTVHETYGQIQIILLTAHGEFEFARQAIQHGVIDYILKPITREKIRQLNELLSRKEEQLIHQRHSYLTAYNADFKEYLITALRSGDRNALDEFFKSQRFEYMMSGEDCNPAGIQLINYLYAYLHELNLNQKAITYSRNETMESFLDIAGRREKVDFIMTKYYDLLTSISQQKNSHSDAIAAYAVRYIREHYTDPEFNLSGLSYSMNVSLSYLSTVFKQATGNNLSTYVAELRHEKAMELLADLQYPISEVSFRCGYSDAKYFAKLFKKRTGSTPSEYRNLLFQGGAHGN